ncbi:MAG: dihydropteroate synthase, partial [Pseudobdellovibrio sp.]
DWWTQRSSELQEQGLAGEKLIFDPGIGFGKSKTQSLFILNHLEQFSEIRNDVMMGYSRKSFQTLFSDREPSKRDLETALSTFQLNPAFTQYLRVHDVETQRLALQAGVLRV